MKYIALFLSVLLIFPPSARAACNGTDDRETLSAAERAELAERMEGVPYPEGNHWTATKGGQVLHLIGTVHVEDPRLQGVFAGLQPVLDQADLLLVEMTAAEEKKMTDAIATRPELLFLTTGPTLPELLDEEAWQTIAEAARSRGIPPIMAAKFQPWYLSMTLSMPACVIQQLKDKQRGLDHMVMAYAEDIDLPQQSLEPYDTLFRLFGQEPLETQVEFLSLGAMSEAAAENAIATLINGYFEEKAAEIFALTYITARREIDMPADELDALLDQMFTKLLEDRNRTWMDRILAAPEGVTVIAAGAGHLPGEGGLLSLLAAEGYTLERQPF